MRKMITLIALVTLIFGGCLYTQEAEKPAPEEKAVTTTGIIRDDMVAIGGEITRFVLQKDKVGIQQLDHAEVGDLTKYVGKKVKVTGTIYHKEYIESGDTPILKIKQIELLLPQKEEPSQKPEISPKLKAKIEELIKKLGDDDRKTREEAQKELTKIGQPILFLLTDNLDSKDPEIQVRAERILSQLEPELSDDEIATLEKRLNEAKDHTKDILQRLFEKWWIIEGGTPVNDLQLTIRSDKKAYSLGLGIGLTENITIWFRLSNVGEKDLYLGKDFDWASYSYEITNPAKLVEKLEAWAEVEQPVSPLTRDDFVLLKEGEVYSAKRVSEFQINLKKIVFPALSTYDDTKPYWLLSKPGRYQITMRYCNKHAGKELGLKAWTGELVSNTITIEIKE